jgi:DNA-binding NtrC family response regulator
MPALREHQEDIPQLTEALLADMNAKHSRNVGAVSDAVLEKFMAYSWPGNVREMRNMLERAVIVCNGPLIEPQHLPPNFGAGLPAAGVRFQDEARTVRLGVGTTVGEAERQLILKTLESTNNNKTRAAEILGISLKTLHNKLKEYSLQSVATDAHS